jgi:hypothetical protein
MQPRRNLFLLVKAGAFSSLRGGFRISGSSLPPRGIVDLRT